MPDRFHVLFVCTGNICRSALAERWMRHQLEQRLGHRAEIIEVTSAGVRAMVGDPVETNSAAALRRIGGDPGDFCARQLEVSMLAEADLVLVATRKHRATTARILPSATTRTFTIREFGRLAMQVRGHDLGEGTPVERLRGCVRRVGAMRGTVAKEGPGADDVADPYGGPPHGHAEAAAAITSALAPAIDLLTAVVDPGQADSLDAANQARREEANRKSQRLIRQRQPSWLARMVVPVLVFGPLLGVPALLAFQAFSAKGELDAAKNVAGELKAAALAGDEVRARRELRELQDHTQAARGSLSGSLWDHAEALPTIGDDVAAVRTVARTLDDVSHDVLPPLVDVAASVHPSKLRTNGNQIALRPLIEARPKLRTAHTRVVRAERAVAAVSTAGLMTTISRELTDLQAQLTDLEDVTMKAAAAADILPPLLGAEGKKTYFLAFQNNAEARGTGGLLGAYGILEADNGKLRITRLGSNQELENAPQVPVNLGKGFARLYGNDPRMWINSNVSPHFPYAARIWSALWKRQHDQRLDGVIATDPVAMGYVLAATGPATLRRGEKITSDNAARLTMRDVYQRYPSVTDNEKRDRYLQRIAGAVFARVLSGKGNPRQLVTALAKAAGERRLLVYSATPAVQQQLSRFPIAGVVPAGPEPYVGVSVNSAVPSKLDYYLDRSIAYVSKTCTPQARHSRVTASFTNAAPRRGLPAYVAFPLDQRPEALDGMPRGSNYVFVDVAVPAGAGLRRAMIDGERTGVIAARERGRPVFRYKLTLAPGQTRRLTFDLIEPVRPDQVDEKVTILRQPLVRPVQVAVERKPC